MIPEILPEPILVGRERELEELKQTLRLAIEGRGVTVFISGEAGSGKTRLITEFLKTVNQKEITVLTGWCLSDAALPYFPFIEAFNSYVSNSGDEVASAVNERARLTSWLVKTKQLEDKSNLSAIQPELWKNHAFYGVSEELMFLSTKKPVVLALEDIHWADSGSISLLHYLARQVGSERILILATLRTEELSISGEISPSPLLKTLHLMGRNDLYNEIKLSNLNAAEVGGIAESMLGGGLKPEFVERIAKESNGNPLFVVESLRTLYQQGKLFIKDSKWNLSADFLEIPRKVRDVILRRLERLNEWERKTLEAASAVGERFDANLVANVISRDNLDVLRTLNRIAERTLLLRCEGSSYRFEHAKFREMLYNEIPLPMKQAYHLRIAEKIENDSMQGANEVSVDDLAYHFVQAQSAVKAIKYSLQAGKAALSKFSNVEAIKHFSYVLTKTKDDAMFADERLRALEGLGDAYIANSMFSEAIKTFDLLAAAETGNGKLRAIRKAMDAAFLKGDKPDLLLAYAKRAEELALDNRLEMAKVINNRARAFAWAGRGDPKMGIADHEAALRVFEEENSLPDIAEALWRSGEALTHSRGKDIDRLLRSRAIFRELGDIRKEVAVTRSVAFGFNTLALFPEARRELSNVLRVGEKLGIYSELARACGLLSLMDEFDGKLDEALSKILKALQYCEKTDASYIRGLDLAAFTRIYSKLGDLKRADEYFDRMVKLPSEVLSQALVSMFVSASKGTYFAAKGRWEEAKEMFETPALKRGVLPHLREYAWALEKQGRLEEARIQRNRVEKLSKQSQKRFKHANLRLSVLIPSKVQIGEEFEIRLDIVNVSRNQGTLSIIEGLIPSDCKVTSLPSSCSTQNGVVIISNVRIEPFQVETIKLRAAFSKASVYNLNPAISYVDDLGKNRTKRSNPVTITVKLGSLEDKTKSTTEPLEVQFDFNSKAAEKAFNFLVKAFREDYIANRMPQEKSGWRTLMDVVRNAPVTMHSMYGRTGKGGKATRELERLGLAEQRFFLGERGRGGRVIKMRICYEKEPVKHRVSYQRG